mmetsp:Transcript_116816/g.337504  ORF Transcript_116816/g.337504 Transcript_116816/m.337504 type:complete len:84 (+) Transcript_116816:51-302(+)
MTLDVAGQESSSHIGPMKPSGGILTPPRSLKANVNYDKRKVFNKSLLPPMKQKLFIHLPFHFYPTNSISSYAYSNLVPQPQHT